MRSTYVRAGLIFGAVAAFLLSAGAGFGVK